MKKKYLLLWFTVFFYKISIAQEANAYTFYWTYFQIKLEKNIKTNTWEAQKEFPLNQFDEASPFNWNLYDGKELHKNTLNLQFEAEIDGKKIEYIPYFSHNFEENNAAFYDFVTQVDVGDVVKIKGITPEGSPFIIHLLLSKAVKKGNLDEHYEVVWGDKKLNADFKLNEINIEEFKKIALNVPKLFVKGEEKKLREISIVSFDQKDPMQIFYKENNAESPNFINIAKFINKFSAGSLLTLVMDNTGFQLLLTDEHINMNVLKNEVKSSCFDYALPERFSATVWPLRFLDINNELLGCQAPEFVSQTLDGLTFSKKQLLGKYSILGFGLKYEEADILELRNQESLQSAENHSKKYNLNDKIMFYNFLQKTLSNAKTQVIEVLSSDKTLFTDYVMPLKPVNHTILTNGVELSKRFGKSFIENSMYIFAPNGELIYISPFWSNNIIEKYRIIKNVIQEHQKSMSR